MQAPGGAAWLGFARRSRALESAATANQEDPGVESGTATFATLRQGYVYNVRAYPKDQEGNTSLGFVPIWASPGTHITLTPAGITDPLRASVLALSPGNDSVNIDVANYFLDSVVTAQPVTVLDANRIEFEGFDPAAGLRLPTSFDEEDQPPPEALVTAVPRDIREALGTPAYSLSGITWTRAGNRVLFATSPHASPVDATSTVSDTLSVYVRGVSAGDDTVTVTAINSLGQQITGSFTVHVLAAVSVSLLLKASSQK